MAFNKKATFTKAEFLTATKFGKKYGISNQLALKAFVSLYKQGRCAKTDHSNLTSVITRNRASHREISCYLAHPLFHDIILNEIEKQKKLLQQKGKSNEI